MNTDNTLSISGTGVEEDEPDPDPEPTSLNEDVANSLLKLYPNPAQEKVCVEIEKELVGKNYRIMDHTGRVLLNGRLESEKNTITLESLSNGVYFLVVDGERGLARKLVKR